jgi:hypothetical protein
MPVCACGREVAIGRDNRGDACFYCAHGRSEMAQGEVKDASRIGNQEGWTVFTLLRESSGQFWCERGLHDKRHRNGVGEVRSIAYYERDASGRWKRCEFAERSKL